jgi:hypothetical protein
LGFLAGRGMGPLALAFGKIHEVGYGFGRVFFEEAANDVAFTGFKGGVESGLAGHEVLSVVGGFSCVNALFSNRLATADSRVGCLYLSQFGVAGALGALAAAGFAGLAAAGAAVP